MRTIGKLGLLWALAGCYATPETSMTTARRTVEVVFARPDHSLASCVPGFEGQFIEHPEGVIFYERDSRIRVRVPAGSEPYHVHLFHRIMGHLIDQTLVPPQGGDPFYVDLATFPDPEYLVVASAAHQIRPDDRDREPIMLPSYALSFTFVPLASAEPVMAVQDFRHDIETPVGTLSLFAQGINRSDLLLTLVDREQKLSRILADSYFCALAYDAYLAPRLVLDVEERGGRPWQRIGAWPAPPSGEVALRTARRELIRIATPPRVTLEFPSDAPSDSAVVNARWSNGPGAPDARLSVGCLLSTGPMPARSYPLSRENATRIPVDLSEMDAARFPLVASVVHRVASRWRTPGGYFRRQPPVRRSRLTPDGEGMAQRHARVMSAAAASHYDLLRFTGPVAGRSAVSPIVAVGALSPNVLPGATSSVLVAVNPPGGGGLTPAGPFGGGGALATGGGSGSVPLPPVPMGWNQNRPPKPEEPRIVDIDLKAKCGCQACACDRHSWSMSSILATFVNRYPNAADFDWVGRQRGEIPCHRRVWIGEMIVKEWGPRGWLDMRHTVCRVYLEFGPCLPKQGNDGGGDNGGAPPHVDGGDAPPPPEDPDPPDAPMGDVPRDPERPDTPTPGTGDLPPAPGAPPVDEGIKLEFDEEDGSEEGAGSSFNDPQWTIELGRLVSGIEGPRSALMAGHHLVSLAFLLQKEPMDPAAHRRRSAAYWIRLESGTDAAAWDEPIPMPWHWTVVGSPRSGGSTPAEVTPPHEPAPAPEPRPH